MENQNKLILSCKKPLNEIIFQLDRFKHVYVVGCGKAAAPMAEAVESICGDHIASGHITVKYGYTSKKSFRCCTLFEAGHPEPDENSMYAGKHVFSLLDSASEKDFIIALLSGGGSSLWFLPEDKISLEDVIILNRVLLACGATIGEINTIRKQVTRLTGGRAASIAYPAKILVLSISDVIGDYPETIASGPFSKNNTNAEDAIQIIDKYEIRNKIPQSILLHLYSKREKCISKENCHEYSNVTYCICGNNDKALRAIIKKAKDSNFAAILINRATYGEAKIAAKHFVNQIREEVLKNNWEKCCIIAGGETTVTLSNKHGVGGRNQEFALAAAIELHHAFSNDERYCISILSAGTDGGDGPTDASGAIVNASYFKSVNNDNLSDAQNALEEHDSYHFFKQNGGLVQTGPTNTNVMDIQIAIIEKRYVN